MSNKYLTVSEVAKYTNIPNATLKRYILYHTQYVDYKKASRMYLINIESKVANYGYLYVNKTYFESGTITEKEIEICELLTIQQEEIDLLKIYKEIKGH